MIERVMLLQSCNAVAEVSRDDDDNGVMCDDGDDLLLNPIPAKGVHMLHCGYFWFVVVIVWHAGIHWWHTK